MLCPQCRHDNSAGMKFCGECGARLALTCPSCRTANEPSRKFCGECGGRLEQQEAAGQQSAPAVHLPSHLAERILTSRSALEGERKQVTVLFADLKGSMELLADRDPEDARRLLDPVLQHMMEAVHRFEGTVNQVMGDGIMALFGAPLAHEDHAVRACYAALRMQETVKRYAEDIRRVEGVPIRIRVGLNSGEVLVRSIGNDLHMDYTAIGQTTHLAARMEQMADPGSILITAGTLSPAEGYIRVKSLGPLPVKGLGESVELYELVGAEAVRSRLHAAAARGLTPFVGRDPEMEQLRLGLESARAGRGQVVAVVGEPGVGKSRLYWEFTHSHRTEGWLVLESRSVSYGTATSYLPVIDLLRGYFQIEARDDHRRMREKITGKLLSLDEGLRSALAPLFGLLDLPVEDPAWLGLEPAIRRQRTLDAAKRLLLRESQVQPVLVIFEDLHWIDGETQALLDSLLESLPTARLLLLVNYRPEYQHGWGSKTYYRQLQIAPLAPETADALLEGLLGTDAALDPLKSTLIQRTEGNPFFLEESVRVLVETGTLVGARGSHRLAGELLSIQVPSTVQAILAARIDRLPPEEKRLLQTAAVIGKEVPFPLLEALGGVPEGELRRHLANLQAAEFLYEARLFPDVEYTFKHALTQEVAFASVTAERRRMLDAAIVNAIEQLAGERLGEHVERLASHAFRGELWPKAGTYLYQAAQRAMQRPAYREAVANLDRALIALARQPEDRRTQVQFVDVNFALGVALLTRGDLRAALVRVRDALSVAERLNDVHRIAQNSVRLAHVFIQLGQATDALPHGRRALDVVKTLDAAGLHVAASTIVGLNHYVLGDYGLGEQHFDQSLELIRSGLADGAALPFGDVFRTYAWLVLTLVELGEFDRALAVAREVMARAETAPYPNPLVRFVTPWVHMSRGDFDLAIPDLERGLAICTSVDHLIMVPPYLAALGRAYSLADRSGEAIPLLERAIEMGESHNRGNRSLFLSFLAEAYLHVGRFDDATRMARRGLEGARDRKERGEEAWSLHALGAIAARLDPSDTETAHGHFCDAMALGGERGMRPLIARCHLGLGGLYRRTGDRGKAREHLATAAAMLREIGMAFWVRQAEAQVAVLSAL